MFRLSTVILALAILAALAPPVFAQSSEREPESISSLVLGEQVSGSRLTYDDLEGRVVLVYAWCVS